MEQPAVSHQLRILRDLGLIRGTRSSRHIVYGLHDSHVAALIDEALRHIDHVQHKDPEPQRTTSPKEIPR
jgi:DNA-binding transcriptional ArsR family regulator